MQVNYLDFKSSSPQQQCCTQQLGCQEIPGSLSNSYCVSTIESNRTQQCFCGKIENSNLECQEHIPPCCQDQDTSYQNSPSWEDKKPPPKSFMETLKVSTWAKHRDRDLEGRVECVESPLGRPDPLLYSEGPMALFFYYYLLILTPTPLLPQSTEEEKAVSQFPFCFLRQTHSPFNGFQGDIKNKGHQ